MVSPTDFRGDFQRAVQRLRGALIELYGSVGADPGAPQDVSRRLGINRNLAWKIGRIIREPDAVRAYVHLPRTGSFEILLDAFARARAGEVAIVGVRTALTEFDDVMTRHAGDRATFDIMVANLGPDVDDGPFSETSRRLSYLGNSAIWGVQATVRFHTQIIAANRDEPDRLDNAMIGGVLNYARLRPGVRWPLAQRFMRRAGGDLPGSYVEPIDPDSDPGNGIPLMPEFCSRPIPLLRSFPEGDFTITELCEGPVGKTGSLSCVFGWIHRRYGQVYREPDDIYHEHILRLDTPAEIAVLDLLVHRDLPYVLPPKLCLYSMMHGRMSFPICTSTRQHLPCAEPVHDLGSGPPVVATPHAPDYPRMVRVATERLGHDLEQFHGYRFAISYPPIPTIADLYYERPERTR